MQMGGGWILVWLLLGISAVGALAEPAVSGAEVLPERVSTFKIKTRSELNKEIPFYLRVPKNYQPGKPHRLLFLCPHVNGLGLDKLANSEQWLALADERDWFILSCTFMQALDAVYDRKLSYYYPEGFSGKAVLEALEKVAGKFSVDTERILLQGASGGAQFVHRFARWAPERVTAVAVNSSSWFDPPDEKSKWLGWLITIGDSDPSYNESLAMVDKLRLAGAAPLFRSYVGIGHEGTWDAERLGMAFLEFYDVQTRKNLGKKRDILTPDKERLSLREERMPYVGDTQDWKFLANTPEARESIPEDSRVFIPNKAIAEKWGTQEGE